jgi:hypothetical protein
VIRVVSYRLRFVVVKGLFLPDMSLLLHTAHSTRSFLAEKRKYAIVKVLFSQISFCAKSGGICERISVGLAGRANPRREANHPRAVRRPRCL